MLLTSLLFAATLCPLSQPVITFAIANNYYSQAAWPGAVTARGPLPFVLELDELPMFFSSFDGFSQAIDNGDLTRWRFYQRVDGEGCFLATWTASAIPDAPFTPLWCATGWQTFCGPRKGETMKVQVCDSADNMAEIITPCVQTSRGSKCGGNQ